MNKIYSEDIVKKCADEKDYKIDLPLKDSIVFEIGKRKKFRITIQRNKLEIMEINGFHLIAIPRSSNVFLIDSKREIK